MIGECTEFEAIYFTGLCSAAWILVMLWKCFSYQLRDTDDPDLVEVLWCGKRVGGWWYDPITGQPHFYPWHDKWGWGYPLAKRPEGVPAPPARTSHTTEGG